MKILNVLPYFSPRMGGPVQVVNNLSNYLGKLGHKVDVLTTDYFSEEIKELDHNYQVIRLRNLYTGNNFFFSPSIFPWLLNNIRSYDVVHLHDYRTFQNAMSYYIAQLFKIPYVITPHGTIPIVSRLFRAKLVYDILFGRRIIKNAYHAFAVSRVEQDQLVQAGIQRDKISLTYNGFDLAEFSNLPPPKKFRTKFSIDLDTKIILCLGRINVVKGFDKVIESLHQVKNKISDVVLVIVGPDDGHLDNLHDLVNELDLKDNVIFTGGLYGDEKIAAYVDADVFIHNAYFEPFGLVVFEALLCGTPVIISKESGASEIIHQIDSSNIIPYGDVHRLAEKIIGVLENKNDNLNFVKKCVNYVEENLSWESVASIYIDVYERILSTR